MSERVQRARPQMIGGSVWGRPTWTVLVRPSRFTYELIEQTGDFTVSVPGPDMEQACKLLDYVKEWEHGTTPDDRRKAWEKILTANQVEWAIIPSDSDLVKALTGKGWKKLYEDETAIILRK